KVAKGAIVSSGDAETIIFATKFELAAEAPAPELFAFAAPEGAAKVEATAASMVYADVQPIFHRNCTGCHGAGLARANLNMASYGGIQKGGKSGPGFMAGDPDNSLILQHMRGQKRQ